MGVDGGGLKEVMEQSRYQSQQTAPLLSNEQEGLVNKLAKEPPQLVMETRPTAAGASDWLSQRPGRSRASSAGKVSTPRARPRKRKKKKINIVQYRCLSYFSLLQGGKKLFPVCFVSREILPPPYAIYIHQVCKQPKKRCNQHKTKTKLDLVLKCGHKNWNSK